MSAPPEAADMEEHAEASGRAGKSGEKFDQVQYEVIREANRFFETLALFNGGALVLSVTFLGYVSSKPGVKVSCVSALYAPWAFLLGGLLASVFRNLWHQDYLYFATLAQWAGNVERLKESEIRLTEGGGRIIVDSDCKPLEVREVVNQLGNNRDSWRGVKNKADKRASRRERLFVICQYIAQFGFVLGLGLLVFFAIANTP